MSNEKLDITNFMSGLQKRNPGETEFHQAVEEVAEYIIPFVNENEKYREAAILERMTEPDRIIVFVYAGKMTKATLEPTVGIESNLTTLLGPISGDLDFTLL